MQGATTKQESGDSEPRPGAGAARELLPLVYAQLHAAARRLMSGERANHTLQPTALVSEAYARLAKDLAAGWPGRREFYLAAAEAMRRILIEHARKRGAAKRGGDWTRAALDVVGSGLRTWGGRDRARTCPSRRDMLPPWTRGGTPPRCSWMTP